MNPLLRSNLHVRILAGAALIAAGLIAVSCGADVSVDNEVDIAGCYDAQGKRLVLRDGEVAADGAKIAKYSRGMNQAGSFVRFTPGVRVERTDRGSAIVAGHMPENVVTTIIENGRPTILLPSEPLGLAKFTKTSC